MLAKQYKNLIKGKKNLLFLSNIKYKGQNQISLLIKESKKIKYLLKYLFDKKTNGSRVIHLSSAITPTCLTLYLIFLPCLNRKKNVPENL